MGRKAASKNPPDPQLAELGEAIREARLAADLTQEQLGEMSGISRYRIMMIENGTARDFRLKTLRSLAEAVGLTVYVTLEPDETRKN